MSVQVCILGSGSSGNATCVFDGEQALLIDAGFSAREMARRLATLSIEPAQISAICVSHEHKDHTAGLSVLHRRHGVPLYANAGTIEGIRSYEPRKDIEWNVFTNGSAFRVGSFQVEPFSVPHDAYDPVGFMVQAHDVRIGIVTDIGVVTNLTRERLKRCQVLVLEANHDEKLLQQSERPWFVKQRILGRQGHLSNAAAAEALAEVAGPELDQVFLVHLSSDCNTSELAEKTVQEALLQRGYSSVAVHATAQDRVSSVWGQEAALSAVV